MKEGEPHYESMRNFMLAVVLPTRLVGGGCLRKFSFLVEREFDRVTPKFELFHAEVLGRWAGPEVEVSWKGINIKAFSSKLKECRGLTGFPMPLIRGWDGDKLRNIVKSRLDWFQCGKE